MPSYCGRSPNSSRSSSRSVSPLLEFHTTFKPSVQKMRTAPIDPEHEEYRVGAGGIELRHIQIASLEQVSRGSWQPRLIQTTGP